jgi:transcriptional regulator with XRE-family HTH domain
MVYADLYVQRIRQLCQKRGISINKLATMSDVKQSTLDNIVRGLTRNPRVQTLHKIAIAFGMTLSEFLDFPELNAYSFDETDEDE